MYAGCHPLLASLIAGPLEFRTPAYLAGIVILAAVAVWMARGSMAGLGAVTRWLALGLRLVVITALLGALAEPSLRRESRDVAVIAVLDASQSVPAAMQERVDRYLEEARRRNDRVGDRLGTVTATRDALVQQSPSSLTQVVERQNVGAVDGTDLSAALRLALAIRPEDAATRLAIFTDGNETQGSLLQAAEAAKAANIPIDIYPLRYRYESEVLVDRVTSPATARQGENMNVRVVLEATRAARGRLNLLMNGQVVDLDPDSEWSGRPIELNPGTNVYTVTVAALRHGPQQFEAIFEPEIQGQRVIGDQVAENNRATSVTFVSGEGLVLVMCGQEAEYAPLVNTLRAAGIAVEVAPAAAAPRTMVEFSAYDAVIMVNQAAADLTQQQQEELKKYIHDGGGGLVMIGGPNSFGAGGWIGSTLEEALPIRLDPPQKRQMPRGALAIITHSVEMPDGVFYGKQTAEAAVRALSRDDLAGIVEFRGIGGTDWVHPLGRVGDGTAIRQSIQNLQFGDMMDFGPSFELTLDGLLGVQAGQKHVIVISDGDPSPPSPTTIQKYIDANISVSCIGVYPHNAGDTAKMAEIARVTGGRFYAINTQAALATLPQIFIKEAQTVKRALIWEGEAFAPTIVGGMTDTLRGIGGVPGIEGYIVAADREGLSQVTLRGKENDPIAAQWYYGLGRVMTFTSDATAKWAGRWVGWSGFRQFWTQQLRWTMRPSGAANVRISTESRGAETLIIADMLDQNQERLNFASIRGRLAGPDGSSGDIELKQTGPGRYEAVVPTPAAGVYVASMLYKAASDGGVIEGVVQAAINRPFADEFRALVDNAPLLEQVRALTGGRVLATDPNTAELWDRTGLTVPVALTPLWQWLMLAGVALFLMDVGVRRVRLDVIAAWRSLRRMLGRQAQGAGAQIESLQAARAKAQAKMALRATGSAGARESNMAAVKFEASAERVKSGKTEVELGEGTRPTAPPAAIAAPKPSEARPSEGSEGMSALLKAKKKARGEMEDRS